jgi:hypothetical protein
LQGPKDQLRTTLAFQKLRHLKQNIILDTRLRKAFFRQAVQKGYFDYSFVIFSYLILDGAYSYWICGCTVVGMLW